MPIVTIYNDGRSADITRYDKPEGFTGKIERRHQRPSPASMKRLTAVIKAYKAYHTDTPPHWTSYTLIKDPTRRRHFARLHTRPIVTGQRWEIDEEIYFEFLGTLPPLAWTPNGFYMSEFVQGSVTTKYTRNGRKYYCEFAEYPPRKEASR